MPRMIKPSFSRTAHRNRLDSVHSPTRPYLPLISWWSTSFFLYSTPAKGKWGGVDGVGGKRGMCRCLSLSAGPGNASDKNLIRLVRRWIQPASPLSRNLCHRRADEQDERPTRRPFARPYVHSFTHPVSAHAIGWSCIPGDTRRQLKMDGKVEFSSVQVHFSWRLKVTS